MSLDLKTLCSDFLVAPFDFQRRRGLIIKVLEYFYFLVVCVEGVVFSC